MSNTIPETLKKADITRFATRASQIEKAKPAIAYWCNFWITQQIITKGLHNVDEESMAYTTNLLEKLEAAKLTNDDAITDEYAARALIEQFGLEVFSRADNAVRANKATRQTADTFQAAATFLDLLQIWPPLDHEVASKIKYAKFHALRIAKAIKAGDDPNLSNPEPEPEPETEALPALDPNDPDVRALQGNVLDRRASVEDVPDDQDRIQARLAATSILNQSIHPSRDVSATRPTIPSPPSDNAERYYQTSKDVSPIGPPTHTGPPSIGGGYFPRTSNEQQPSPGSEPINLPSAPADLPDSPMNMSPIEPTSNTGILPDLRYNHGQPSGNFPPPQAHVQHPPAVPQYAQSHAYTVPVVSSVVVDDQAMTQAQKHARWAISALNFEDVPTAVKELRNALEQLGARGPW